MLHSKENVSINKYQDTLTQGYSEVEVAASIRRGGKILFICTLAQDLSKVILN